MKWTDKLKKKKPEEPAPSPKPLAPWKRTPREGAIKRWEQEQKNNPHRPTMM